MSKLNQGFRLDFDEFTIEELYQFMETRFHEIPHKQAFDSLLTRLNRLDSQIKKLKEENKIMKKALEFIIIEDSSIKNFWSKTSKTILMNGLLEQSRLARRVLKEIKE